MAVVGTTALGTGLQTLLMCDEISPGADGSYQLCKEIYVRHPLGGKMAKTPVILAQSQARQITVPTGPDRVRDAFIAEWKKMQSDTYIRNVMAMARVYGIASVAAMVEEEDVGQPIDRETFWSRRVSFNVFDPLNTAGSMVLNLNPMAPDFLKPTGIAVNGHAFHPSRSCAVLNEEPVYLAYTTSAFGFVGRSVYQRALFPLKSFINTMRADDMVARKAGLLIAKTKQPGSIIDNAMQALFGAKRQLLKEAETNQVLGIDVDEAIETLNMQNVNHAMQESRNNILKNIAVAADMPAKLLDNETFVEGFGEGTEDAKNVARYIDGVRADMAPLYAYFDELCQLRAWNPEFYATIQNQFPEYKEVSYTDAFYSWKNAFSAEWPSLLKEPESEEIKTVDVRLKALIALIEVYLPSLDPVNKATMLRWGAETFNNLKLLFPDALELDFDSLEEYAVQQADNQQAMAEAAQEPDPAPPFSARDAYDASVTSLMSALAEREGKSRKARLERMVGGAGS